MSASLPVSAASATLPARPAATSARRYRAVRLDGWPAAADDWSGPGTPFQARTWLESWYRAFAVRSDIDPVIVIVQDERTGEVALRLPLIRHRQGGLRVIEFADLNLTDFNAPLLGPAAPTDRAGAAAALRAVKAVLPPADLLRLAKMPPEIAGRANPFVLLKATVPSALNGNVVRMSDSYDAWRHSLGRTYRKELERSWRVFTRANDAAFTRLTEPQEARSLFAVLETMQGERMRGLGNDYFLDDPDVSRVYRGLVDQGLTDGSAVMTALTAEGEVVATLLGLRQGDTYIMIRISQAGGRWANCSPGRLIIERTLSMLHAEGCRIFDFSIGNYDYKRRFKVTRTPLVDYIAPLGLRGVPVALRAGLVGRLREHPALDRRLRDLHARFGGGSRAVADKDADGAASDDARTAS